MTRLVSVKSFNCFCKEFQIPIVLLAKNPRYLHRFYSYIFKGNHRYKNETKYFIFKERKMENERLLNEMPPDNKEAVPPVRIKIGQINDLNRVFEYDEEDNDINSKCFQNMLSCCGRCYICCCIPWACCCGCSGPTRRIDEGYRGILLRFGKFVKILPPGTYTFNISSEEILIVNVRIQTMVIPEQTVITKDGINITVDAVCFLRVNDILKAQLSVQNWQNAVKNLSQYTLETVLGEYQLEHLLQHRNEVATRIEEIICPQTERWGVAVEGLELRDIRIPKELVRVMAAEAEALREGKAKIITARAELEAAEAYAEASKKLSESDGSMQLRYFQTLREIASEKNSTILLPSFLQDLFKK